MKRALQFIIAMSFIAMFLVSPVAAATSQGLEWGVAEDDVFTFRWTVVEEGETTFNENVNFTITAAPPTIPDPVADYLLLPYLSVDYTYANGSAWSTEHSGMLFGLLVTGGHIGVPTGNFTLLYNLYNSSAIMTENTTIVNDATKWGVSFFAEDSTLSAEIVAHYLKTDGFISRYEFTMTNKTSDLASGATLVRASAGFDIVGFLTDNILYVAIGVGVILVLAVVCMKRR